MNSKEVLFIVEVEEFKLSNEQMIKLAKEIDGMFQCKTDVVCKYYPNGEFYQRLEIIFNKNNVPSTETMLQFGLHIGKVVRNI